jgi:hypothetical protein
MPIIPFGQALTAERKSVRPARKACRHHKNADSEPDVPHKEEWAAGLPATGEG